MLKLINDVTDTYRLNIEYQGKEYSYIARCISKELQYESWFVWAAKNRLLKLVYNTATKELKEDLLPGQRPAIPEEFLKILQQSFSDR